MKQTGNRELPLEARNRFTFKASSLVIYFCLLSHSPQSSTPTSNSATHWNQVFKYISLCVYITSALGVYIQIIIGGLER